MEESSEPLGFCQDIKSPIIPPVFGITSRSFCYPNRMHPTPPVLLLVFNRPDLAEQVFAAIRAAKPSRLFVAADGPRADRTEEDLLCEQCRALVRHVDWPCEVMTLFRESNLGCKKAVSSAITWFFEHVEEGIILEDDCMPDASFFPYCADLLEKYRDEPRIAHISGENDQPPGCWKRDTYRFTLFNRIWGWATWRRAWLKYDLNMDLWPQIRDSGQFRGWLGRQDSLCYWTDVFDRCHRGEIDTWDYQWVFSSWANGMFSIAPGCNLITNIGFDERGTHARNEAGYGAGIPSQSILFPLRHPVPIEPDRKADRWSEQVFGIRTGSSKRASRILARIYQHAIRLEFVLLIRKGMERGQRRLHPVAVHWWTLVARFKFWWNGASVGKGLRVYGPLRVNVDPGGSLRIGENARLCSRLKRNSIRSDIPSGFFVEAGAVLVIGPDFRADGPLHIMVRPKGRLEIADNVRIISDPSMNVVGGYVQTTFVVGTGGTLCIGSSVGLSNCAIACDCSIKIGSEVFVGGGARIYDTDFHSVIASKRLAGEEGTRRAPVQLDALAFIGGHTIILKGSVVGTRAILGAGAVLAGRIPAGEIWAGNPARKVGNVPISMPD